MVVCSQEHVESCIAQSFGIAVRGRETGIPTVARASPERHFKIAHGIIGRCDIRCDKVETSGIIIHFAVSLRQSLIELSLMLHGISYKKEVDSWRFLSRGIRADNEAEQRE